MFRCIIALISAFLIFPQLVRADGFSDFRIPKHYVYNLNGGLSGWAHSSYNRYDTDYSKGTNYRSSINESARWIFDSDPLRIDLTQAFSGYGYLDRWWYTDRPNDTTTEKRDGKSQNLSERWSVQGGARVYPWTLPLGFTGSISGYGNYGQGWGHDHQTADVGAHYYGYCRDDNFFSFDYSTSASVGLGYGRVRDATPVYTVFVLEQRLRDLGVLTRDLKPESRQRLAQVLVAATDHQYIHDRPNKFFWQDVERILREDGGLRAEELDAYSLYRIAEPSNSRSSYYYSSSVRRDCGWFAGVALKGSHRHYIRRSFDRTRTQDATDGTYNTDTSITVSDRLESFDDAFSIGPQVEYHRPFGMAWQLDATSTVLFPQQDAPQAIDAQSNARMTWMIADRWIAGGNALYLRKIAEETSSYKYSEHPRSNQWQVSLNASLYYFVVDRVSIGLNIYHDQYRTLSENRDATHSTYHSYSRYNSIELGLSYNFLGALEAPGLTPRATLPKMPRMRWPF